MIEGIIEWFKETFSFIDKELLMIIASCIMAIILIKLLFKVLHRFRVLKLLVAVIIFGGLTAFSVHFVNTHKEIFSQDTRYYVYGTVNFVSGSINTIDIYSSKSNIPNGTGDVVIKIPATAKIYTSDLRNNTVSINELKQGCVVQVYIKDSSYKDGKMHVTANKVIIKYNKSRR